MSYLLIVSADRDLREVLRAILEEEGHLVAEEAEADVALDLLAKSPQRLVVLLDYTLSGGGSKHLLQVICRNVALSTRHAYVLLTARASMSVPVLEAAQALSIPVMRKPFDLEDLLVIVAEAQQRLETG